MDVPFNVTSYTDQLIRDQQAHNLGQVLDNDPAVRSGFGYGNYSQTFVIRGFPLYSDDIAFDGLYGVLPRQLLAPEVVSRVEVFKGASAFVNGVSPGSSGIGGSINIAPKRATAKPITRVGVDYASDGQVGESVDFGRRFGAGDAFGLRVNAVHREGKTAVKGEHHRTNAFALGFDYQGQHLRVTTDLGYQQETIRGGRSTVYVTDFVPKVPDADTNYAQRWASSMLEDTYGVVRAEYDFTSWLTGYVAFGSHHANEYGEYTSPTVIAANGDATEYRFSVPYKANTQTGEAGFNAYFDTGAVSHHVTVGFSGLYLAKRAAYGLSGNFDTNIYHPVQVPMPDNFFTGGSLSDPGVTGRTQLRGLAVSDTLGFVDDNLLLTVGARRQKLHVLGYDYNTGAKNAEYQALATSPVYGIVYKPSEHVSLYANHMEGLSQGPTAPATAVNVGQVFAPYHARQNEIGVKYENGRLGSSLALFRIKQPVGIVNADNVFTIAGQQRNSGVEWSLFGEPVKGLRLLGGATWLKPELTKTQGGANDGNDAVGAPRFQANAGVEWTVPNTHGLRLNARAVYTGDQYVDAANQLRIPSWTTYDVGASYSFHSGRTPTTLRLNVRNLTGESYWASALGGYLSQGEPRSVMMSVSFDL
ncbi:TonB-dependent siderophore receptor [Oleiagrimonas sp. C23AA]|nr:TonB-dependent siderophore receptor [Oleiagrimonas sp. C23AA]